MIRHSKFERVLAGLYLAAPLVFLGLFFAWPTLRLILLSISAPDLSVAHYQKIFTTPVYLKVLTGTVRISLWVSLVSLLLSYPLAFIMVRADRRRLQYILALLLLPWWTSILVRSFAWVVILGQKGLINSSLMPLGFISEPLSLIYNELGVVIGLTHVLLPFAVIPIYSVMRGFDWTLVRAAQSLGASTWAIFRYVFFPLTVPGVLAGGLLVFVQALGFYITPALLGGGRSVMISMLIEAQVNEFLNWGFAAALAIVLLGVAVIILVVYQRLIDVWSIAMLR